MADALLDEVLKANQIKAETIQFLTKDNENLKKHIAKIEDKNASLMEHNSILMAKILCFFLVRLFLLIVLVLNLSELLKVNILIV